MKKYQETIYKVILFFSVLVNLFLIGLLFFVLRDSFSGAGDYFLGGKSFWYFVAIIAVYCIINSYFIIQLLRKGTDIELGKTMEE